MKSTAERKPLMEITPKKVKKTQSRNIILSMLLILAIPFIYDKYTIDQIEDTNGADSALVSFKIKDYKSGDKFIAENDSVASSGFSSKKNADLKQKADFDRIYYSSDKFSGMKVLQETEASGGVTFSIISEIQEGNFEIAIFHDDKGLKVLRAGESEKITFGEAGVYRVIIGGESAKGYVAVQRDFDK